MKHHIVIMLLLLFFLITHNILTAQNAYTARSSATISAGIGGGSFNGYNDVHFISGETEIVVPMPGRVKFSNPSITARFLFATKEFDSRLSLGCELDLQMIEEGDVSPYLETLGGGPVRGPSKMLYAIHFIGDYHILSLSEHIDIKVGAGAGMLFFAYIITRDKDESTLQPSASARLSVPIVVSASTAIEPELRMIMSTGHEKVFLMQAMAGLSFYW